LSKASSDLKYILSYPEFESRLVWDEKYIGEKKEEGIFLVSIQETTI
jgi:hypothetical protein